MTPTDDLARARALAHLLDDAVRIPGTGIRIGLDPVLGLVPGLGDLAGAAMSGYIVVLAARFGAPGVVVLRMLLNIGIDSLLGTVPILGDLFDAGWKSNIRNLTLLERFLEQPDATHAGSRAVIAGIVVALAALAAGSLFLAFSLISWAVSALG